MASKIEGKILDAAIECFSAQGFAGCSTKSIATSADVTEGSVFRLFSSKEKLFAASLKKVVEDSLVAREPARDVLQIEDDFVEAITRAAGILVDSFSRAYVRIGSFAILERADMTRDIVGESVENSIQLFAERIRAEQKRGRLSKRIDADLAAMTFEFALFQMRWLQAVEGSPKLKTLKALRTSVEAAARGFATSLVALPRK